MYQESGLLGHFLVLCTAGSLELPGPLPPLLAPPRQPATPGNEIRFNIAYRAFGRIPLSSMPSGQIWPTTPNSLKKACLTGGEGGGKQPTPVLLQLIFWKLCKRSNEVTQQKVLE